MKLIIGGYAQGKRNYVLSTKQEKEYAVFEGILPDEAVLQSPEVKEKLIVIHQFHKWMKEQLLAGENPEQKILDFVNQRPECIIISDEIGNGIVPIDAFEREYRERTGRILICLAGMADEVVRVLCGIGQKIK